MKSIKIKHEQTLSTKEGGFSLLRGGGCINNSIIHDIYSIDAKNSHNSQTPIGFTNYLIKFTNLLHDKAIQSKQDNSIYEIMTSIQWFMHNQEYFYLMCQNEKLALQHLDLLTLSLDKILKQAPIYLKTSGNMCLYILAICNTFLRVFYSLFIKKKSIQFKKEYIINLEKYIDEIQSILESDLLEVWKTGFEFELLMIKIVIDKLPNEYEQGQEILNSVAFEILISLISLQPSEGLIASIINGGKFLFNKIQNNFAKPIEKYNIYYFFESLKWSVIAQLKRHYSVLTIEKQLMDGYNNYIQSSNDWLIHYCWIKMISDLLTYRPLLQRDIIFSNLSLLEKKENWKKLFDAQQIKPLSYDTNIAKLVFFPKDQRNQLINNFHVDFYNYGINELREFQILLITQKNSSQLKLWSSYITYKSNNNTQSTNQQEESFEFLQIFSSLLEEYQKSKLKLSSIIQSISESLSHLKQEQYQNANLLQLYKNDLITKCQNLQVIIIESIYILNEIDFQLILALQRIQLLENYIEQTNKNQSLILISSISEELKQLYHSNFFILLIKIPKQLYEFQIALKTFENSVNNQQLQGQILDSIKNLTINELFFKIIECLKIIDQKVKRFQVEFENLILTDREMKLSEFILKDKFRNFIQQFDNFNFPVVIIEFIQNLLTLNFKDDKWKSNINQNILDNIENCQQILTFIILNQKLIKNIKEQINISQFNYEGVYNQKQDFEDMENVIGIINIIIEEQRNSVVSMINQTSNYQEGYQFQQLINLIANNQRTITSLNFDSQIKTNLLINMTSISSILIELQFNSHQQLEQVQEKLELIYSNLNLEVKKIDKCGQSKLQIQTSMKTKTEERLIFIDQYLQVLMNLQYFIQQLRDFQISIYQTNQLVSNQNNDQKQQLEVLIQSNFSILRSINQLCSQMEQLIQNKKLNKLALIDSEYLNQVDKIEYKFLFNCLNSLITYTQKKTFLDSIQNEYDETYISIISLFQKCQQSSFSKPIDDEENDCKVRECLFFYLITMQNFIQEGVVTQFCQQMIKQMWIQEKNQKVKQTLYNQELIELQKKLFSSDLSQFINYLKVEMKTKLDLLNSLEYQIHFEGDKAIQVSLQRQLHVSYQEFEEYLDKITEMTQKLDITLELLKENRKILLQVKQKIDQLQNVVDDIALDVRKLRGKQVNELLQIRKQLILQQKDIEELKSIYIELKVDHYDTKTGQKVEKNNVSWLMKRKVNDFSGKKLDVNQKNQKIDAYNYRDVLLIKGQAGAGKSTAAQKIEQFLWQNQNEFKQKWIPIYISLPTIKNPKFNLLEEVLESEFYNFDKIQTREFKELIKQKRINVVLILDSYDEMHFDFIQQNLYQTNRLKEQFKVSEDFPGQNLKIIITTRSEILATSNYQTWFYGEKIDTMIEIELIKFDIEQTEEYLKQHSILNLQTLIFNMYEFVMQFTGKQIDMQEFSQIWSLIYIMVKQDSSNFHGDNLLSSSCINEILKRLQQLEQFKYINQLQFIAFEKEMQKFWSAPKYLKQIQKTNLQSFLVTPFLIELLVHVLPRTQVDLEEIQQQFCKNYIQVKIAQQRSQRLIEDYKMKQFANSDQNMIQSEQEFKKQAQLILEQLLQQHFFNYYSLINQIEQVDFQTVKMNNQLFNLSCTDEIQSVIQAFQLKRLSVYDFYNLFIDQYHEKQILKLQEYGQIKDCESFKYDLMTYSEALALDMSIHQVTSIQYRIKGQLKLKNQIVSRGNENWADQYFDGYDGVQKYNSLLRRAALIIKKGNSYLFTHKSIQDFFVARFILCLIQNIKDYAKLEEQQLNNMNIQHLPNKNIINQCLWMDELNEGFKNLYLYQEQYMGVRNFVVEGIKKKEMTEKLLLVIKLTAIFPDHIRAGSNCAQLLNWFNKNLKFQDLQNIKLEYVNLYGTNFHGSDLRNSQFSHVNINRCNFIKSKLFNIKWQNTILSEKPMLLGHFGIVNSIVFSPDNSTLASCGNDKLVIIWNYKTGKQIRKLQGHKNNVNSVSFALDEIILASCGDDNRIILWQYLEGFILMQLEGHIGSVKQIAFSSDGNTFASCSDDGSILLWDYQVKQQKSILQGHSSCVNSIAFSIDGQTLASGSQDKSVILWNHESGNLVRSLEGHFDDVTTVAFAIDGISLASGSQDRIIIIWDYKQGRELRKLLAHQNGIESITFSQDGQLLASGSSDKTVLLWDFKSAKQIGQLEGHSDVVFSVAFSRDGSTLASCSRDTTIILWDCQASKQMEIVEGHTQSITAIQFSLDGLVIASASADKTIILWNKETGQINQKLDGHSGIVTSLAFSFDGLHLASGSYDKTIILWDIRTGVNIGRIGSHINLVTSLAFSSNGWALASGSYDKAVIVWDYKTRRIISKLEGHSSWVLTVAFSKNGIILASGSKDKTILIWDYRQKKQVGKLEGHLNSVNHIVFSPDEFYLASCSSDCVIIFWDYQTSKQVKKIGDHSNQINQIVFSIDGLTLASVSDDRSIILWDFQTGKLMQKIDGHIGIVTSIAYSPDGKILASGSQDKTIRLHFAHQQQKYLYSYSYPYSSRFEADDAIVNENSKIFNLSQDIIMSLFEQKGAINLKD
ncbi:unnamed protein product [Paramecium pentaurelia]|uniref:NACHT domain-containing protein n=1 Tax=Paramecium pentaurelia TaxID=43138 RepID=A0A8S1STS3_9CILI|nr:unnamed protein product [Paramecium pentaurelia]